MTTDPRLGQVLEGTWPVLLDFDGPVTHLFIDDRNVKVASQMRSVLYRDRSSCPRTSQTPVTLSLSCAGQHRTHLTT